MLRWAAAAAAIAIIFHLIQPSGSALAWWRAQVGVLVWPRVVRPSRGWRKVAHRPKA